MSRMISSRFMASEYFMARHATSPQTGRRDVDDGGGIDGVLAVRDDGDGREKLIRICFWRSAVQRRAADGRVPDRRLDRGHAGGAAEGEPVCARIVPPGRYRVERAVWFRSVSPVGCPGRYN